MDFNEKKFEDIEITSVDEREASKEDRIRYAGILMGYYDSICSLCSLDYKSETIQTLVGLIYTLICILKYWHLGYEKFTPYNFAEEHLEILSAKRNQLIEDHGEEEFDFLVKSIRYFGENN